MARPYTEVPPPPEGLTESAHGTKRRKTTHDQPDADANPFLFFISEQTGRVEDTSTKEVPVSKQTRSARTEKSIGRQFLPNDFSGRHFRVTLQSDNLLVDDYIWQRMLDDLRVIGFLRDCQNEGPGEDSIAERAFDEEMLENLCPLSCTSLCSKGVLYKPVFRHLPLVYAVRLSILRFLGQRIFQASTRFGNENEIIKLLKKSKIQRIVLFFQQFIKEVDSGPTERCLPAEESKEAPRMKRARIDFVELGIRGFHVKTWQPTLCSHFILAVVNSCKKIFSQAECLGLANFTMGGQLIRDFHFNESTLSPVLADYPWEDGGDLHEKYSISKARRTMIYMLCEDVYICGLFCTKQMWVTARDCARYGSIIAAFISSETAKSLESASMDVKKKLEYDGLCNAYSPTKGGDRKVEVAAKPAASSVDSIASSVEIDCEQNVISVNIDNPQSVDAGKLNDAFMAKQMEIVPSLLITAVCISIAFFTVALYTECCFLLPVLQLSILVPLGFVLIGIVCSNDPLNFLSVRLGSFMFALQCLWTALFFVANVQVSDDPEGMVLYGVAAFILKVGLTSSTDRILNGVFNIWAYLYFQWNADQPLIATRATASVFVKISVVLFAELLGDVVIRIRRRTFYSAN